MSRRLTVVAAALAVVAAGCGLAYEDPGTTTTSTTLADESPTPTGPADLVFGDQRVAGTSVVLDSVSMPAPGFVVLRVDDGGVPGDIVGIGDVLVRGVVANVEVPLFVPLSDDLVVHATLHVDLDADGVFSYEPPDDVVDLPATKANGEDATAVALIELLPPLGPAEIEFADQRTLGDLVVVPSVTLPAAGFVGVWTSEEGEPGVLVGRSELLGPGTSTDVAIEIDPPATESVPLIAAAHIDRDEDGRLVPGDEFDPFARTLDDLDAVSTGFITVVLLAPSEVVASDQEDEQGDAIVVSSIALPWPGFLEIVLGDEVLVVTEHGVGTDEDLIFEIGPFEPGEYELVARIRIDFDGDGSLTDADPVGVTADGGAAETTFVFTVPVPDDDADADADTDA